MKIPIIIKMGSRSKLSSSVRVLMSVIMLLLSFSTISVSEDAKDVPQEQTSGSVVVSFCEICNCVQVDNPKDGYEAQLQIICNQGFSKDWPGLGTVEWPDNPEKLLISATFENLEMKSVEKIKKNDRVIFLDFNHNEIGTIYPNAFVDLINLKCLRLSNNVISVVTPDMFKNLKSLIGLDLSNNRLTEFNPLDFSELPSLKKLSLKHNYHFQIPLETLLKITTLEELDLSENQIISLNFVDQSDGTNLLKNLKNLDLSFNKLKTISKNTIIEANKLEFLNLSNNGIESIDQEAFLECPLLHTLDLSYNSLSLLESLPPSAQRLHLQGNSFHNWPQLSYTVRYLDLSKNSLSNIYSEKHFDFKLLEYLNISNNMLSSLELKRPLPELLVLDLSNNIFQEVPPSLSSIIIPKLEVLHLNGNPMRKLQFPSQLELSKLYANNLNEVIELDASSFVNISGKNTVEEMEGTVQDSKKSGCLDVSISHCSKLETIHENTFGGIKLCHMDISYNNLKNLSAEVADWSFAVRGINLQGNPWDCQCSLQWLLDELLDDLYSNHQLYLNELRCNTPRSLHGLRLVHWYNRSNKAFCDGNSNYNRQISQYNLESSIQNENNLGGMFSSGSAIGILAAIAVGSVLVIGLIVYLVRGKYRHDYRVRQVMQRRRQTMKDAQHFNKLTTDENNPLKL